MTVTCGCRLLDVDDTVQQATIPLALLYPTDAPETTEQFGPYALDVARDAPPAGGPFPLIVVSHGNSGTPWAYRDLARHLVHAGYVVALPAHPGNTRHNNNRANTAANLANRPRHISLVIDAAYGHPALAGRLLADRVAVIGHSIGGYTALAVAGGLPWTGPYERKTNPPQPVPVTPDARVRALVLLAPATAWFRPESLRAIRLPILMITGDRDTNTPVEHAVNVLDGVADRAQLTHKVFAGAGHFSFMSKFPAAMTKPEFHPSQDPPGFDRADIEQELFADIGAFLAAALNPPPACDETR
jgi:predicted dienelactone hydrolase